LGHAAPRECVHEQQFMHVLDPFWHRYGCNPVLICSSPFVRLVV
jgi:hypothetical protein